MFFPQGKGYNKYMFEEAYKKLNKEQQEAVDTIDGPVMVVAGPGTGKTEILALRIANILTKTDTKGDSVLCLTFTNSAVKAMRERLRKHIGVEASKVHISTFHSFGMDIAEKYFGVLGLDEMPKIMDEKDSISLCDDILHNNEWEHIRPRADNARYFGDLKNLISLLKRERMDPKEFENLIKQEIKRIEADPENISSRGPTKGELKKEIQKKIEGLERSKEAMRFYELYEQAKKEKNFFDYDDVLENLVKIVESSEDAADFIKINYQYVLIDEHQDSSGVQNEFLERVWGDVEKPNIFVVGDDRQLIYGFGGASLEYFENFKHTFGKAKLITLVENYRSTQKILDVSHSLLQSSITEEKLKSNTKENHALRLVEASYPRDEIIACGLEIKERLKKKENPNEMAVLVPKNRQARSAVAILRDMGIPVASGEKLNFFDSHEAQAMLRVLKIIASPGDGVALSESFFDKLSGIPPLEAHKFVKENKMREFSLLTIPVNAPALFENPVIAWMNKLKSWLDNSTGQNIYSLIQSIGSEFLLDTAKDHEDLVMRIEVIRTLLHLVLSQIERSTRPDGRRGGNAKLSLKDFLMFIDRLESYGEHIPLAVFSADEGVKILTLHGSKGLEFDYVWIAHMDEKSLSGSKRGGFSLPEALEEKVEKKDEEVLKRELYVAITRAKRFCTLSYSQRSYTGGGLELSPVVLDLESNFERQSAQETEKIILTYDPKLYIEKVSNESINITLGDLQKLVAKDYEDRKVSVSLLNNFFECPWKWYFRNLLQLPETKSESLEFGNIVHGSIDKILQSKVIPDEMEVKGIIGGEVKKTGFGGDKKQAQLAREAFSIVSIWVQNRLPDISKNRENEQDISVSDERFSHLQIYGKVDLIEIMPDGIVKVTDFKTGNSHKKSEIEKLDGEGRMGSLLRQLAMYSYLLRENPKWKKIVSESCLEFVQSKDAKDYFYKTCIDDENIDLLIRDIVDYDTLVKDGSWTSRKCNFKSYGKQNAVCEYCERSKIYKQNPTPLVIPVETGI